MTANHVTFPKYNPCSFGFAANDDCQDNTRDDQCLGLWELPFQQKRTSSTPIPYNIFANHHHHSRFLNIAPKSFSTERAEVSLHTFLFRGASSKHLFQHPIQRNRYFRKTRWVLETSQRYATRHRCRYVRSLGPSHISRVRMG